MSSDESSADILKRVLCLERDFPEEYRAIRAILSKVAPSAIAKENDHLRSKLVDIVYSYGRNRSRSQYRKEAAQFADQTLSLIDNLDLALEMFKKLDPVYKRRMADFMSKNSADFNDYNLGHILRDLRQAQIAASLCRLAIYVATYHEIRPGGRSRPSIPHFVPTVQLMDLWERLTGKEIVTPKGVATGKSKPEAAQPSTEFVRLGLKMIDPTITVANTITLIKRALAEKKESQLTTFIDLIEMPAWCDLAKGLKLLQETNEI